MLAQNVSDVKLFCVNIFAVEAHSGALIQQTRVLVVHV